ncbi:methyl-accepting chemotaxis protein [Clostridium oryzae]|uniref:Putative sensory transducer protein YfmS n=1 Tax=Clostridium oryzae TaxID=1450648 RepID=A0A1V4IIE6_9CLOT|nr:methyl-accepting chemotaxis protein [Clostridium oryzae]OPJ59723.1 putative sensory transducer protein YfmS [Clostridium oryzae]
MEISDEQYFESINNLFDVLPNLFPSDTAVGLTNTEKFVFVKQSDSFKLNVEVGTTLTEDGASKNAIRTKNVDRRSSPKELFGYSINTTTVPVINNSTGNVLGTIVCAVSQEKVDNVISVANDLKTFSEQLTASAQQMASSAEELSASSHNIEELANRSSEGINKMDDVLKYITEISNTTNMLGLNAAIEAARAGEHGRGFSVVAQEIRNLATQSKTSVTDIDNSLKEIKADINNIVEFIQKYTSTSENQAAQAEELSSSSESISESAARLLEFAHKL